MLYKIVTIFCAVCLAGIAAGVLVIGLVLIGVPNPTVPNYVGAFICLVCALSFIALAHRVAVGRAT